MNLLKRFVRGGGCGCHARPFSKFVIPDNSRTAKFATGPLSGINVVELEGLAIAPFIGKLLQDYGARIIRVDRRDRKPHYGTTALGRDKHVMQLDLKDEEDKKMFLEMIADQDILIDPYRPGVMERLGLGEKKLKEVNKRLIYTRVTGYGGTGPLANAAGHDINYLAISGVLSMLSRQLENGTVSRPMPPVNFLGDFAGGGLSAGFGIMLALYEREKSGLGQTVDVSVLDGLNYMSGFFHNLMQKGGWDDLSPGTHMIDTGAHFYEVYECKNPGEFVAVGAIEPQFYRNLVACMGLDPKVLPAQDDEGTWPSMKEQFSSIFKTKTRDEWDEVCAEKDTCLTPVLTLEDMWSHPHSIDRDMFGPALKNECGEHAPSGPVRLSRTPNMSMVYTGPDFSFIDPPRYTFADKLGLNDLDIDDEGFFADVLIPPKKREPEDDDDK